MFAGVCVCVPSAKALHQLISEQVLNGLTMLLLLPPQDDLRGRNLSDSGERPYALAKTYLLMGLTRELARRLEGSGVDVIAGATTGCATAPFSWTAALSSSLQLSCLSLLVVVCKQLLASSSLPVLLPASWAVLTVCQGTAQCRISTAWRGSCWRSVIADCMEATFCAPSFLPAVHPGVTNSSWYKKADDDTYLFSWVISRVLSVLPWLGVGQPTGAGAISSIYVSGASGSRSGSSVAGARAVSGAASKCTTVQGDATCICTVLQLHTAA